MPPALQIDADGTTNAIVSVTRSTFTNNYGDHFQFSTDPASTGTDSLTFSGNALTNSATGIYGGSVDISPDGNANTTINVDGNNIQDPVGDGIEIDEDGTTGTLAGTVHANTIGAPAVTNSGGSTGIAIPAEGSATETLAITGGTENANAVQTFLQGSNNVNGTPTAVAFPSGSGGGFVGGSSC